MDAVAVNDKLVQDSWNIDSPLVKVRTHGLVSVACCQIVFVSRLWPCGIERRFKASPKRINEDKRVQSPGTPAKGSWRIREDARIISLLINQILR